MSKLTLNLARRPFVNKRPLIVATAVLALATALLTYGNVYHTMKAMARHRVLTEQITANRAETRAARDSTKALQNKLGEREARHIRRVAESISGIIRKRRLSWSRLFDELAVVMPDDVRVLSIAPSVQGSHINLLLVGLAKTDEAKLRFLTRLHESPFSAARLTGESPEEGEVRFVISCRYDPKEAEAAAAGSDDVDEDAAGASRRTAARSLYGAGGPVLARAAGRSMPGGAGER